jgi:hypothetical protein
LNSLALGSAAGATLWTPSSAAPAEAPSEPRPSIWKSPFDVGNHAQLFIDQVLVRRSDGCSFRLHPAVKHPRNPLMRADREWEGWRVEIYGSVLYDEDERLFKMWYIGENKGFFGELVNPALYATSKDGITWDKPLVGTLSGKSPHHNAVAGTDIPSVMKDNADPDPSRRYKMICFIVYPQKDRGYHTMTSPDGLHWTKFSEEPICPGGDVITGYYDRGRKLYVAFAKIMTEWAGFSRRVFYIITSSDFVHWSKPKLVFTPDLRDDASSLARLEEVRHSLDVPDNGAVMRTEFYGIPVYSHESCLITFPWIFTINNNARYGNQDGAMEAQIAVSRDLEYFDRQFRLPVIPVGPPGSWDDSEIDTASHAIRVGDEIRMYYGGSNLTHGGPALYRSEGTGRLTKYTDSIGLATWKLDRFVSVDASSDGGTLETVPLVHSGSYLELNASTKSGGQIQVELQDVTGKVLGASHPFHGDEFRHRVTWMHDPAIGSTIGKPVKLVFRMKSASLFSFAFRSSPANSGA